MTPHPPRRARRALERGMATAEYAVGTAGVVCISCIVMKMGADGWGGLVTDLLERLRSLGAWLSVWSSPWHPLR
jgi:hypothetical protein